jgi:hypothetical protein
MARLHTLICGAALIAVLPLSACSSNGRVSTAGGFGASAAPPAGQPSGDDDGDGSSGDGSTTSTLGGALFVTAGNLGDTLESGDPNSLPDDPSPLARVSVGEERAFGGGSSSSALGLSLGSETQEQGDVATLGVLSDGEVITADASGAANGDLIGATLDGDQVVGEGDQQSIGVGALSPSGSSGDVASVNVLSGGQALDVQVPDGSTSLLDTLRSLGGQN